MEHFYVLRWNQTKDDIEHYDILPYFLDKFNELVKKKRVKRNSVDMEWLKDFIDREAKYTFWSRCEYEIVVAGWPRWKNERKIDIYWQIKPNIDVIAELLYRKI